MFGKKQVLFFILMVTVSLTGFIACQPKLAPQSDCNFVMSAQIQRVSWKTNLPVKLYISPGIPQELREGIRIAASQWNFKIGKEAISIMESDNTPQSPSQDGVNAIYWQTTWETNRQNEQARTTIHWKGDIINEADILVNAKDHQFTPFGQLEPDKIDFTSLMVHEMGHLLGLQHIPDIPSVMNPTLALDTQRFVPYDVDVKSVKCEYN
jgi:hypothetical protein